MSRNGKSIWKPVLIGLVIVITPPALIVGIVGVQTWTPLAEAGKSLELLEEELGAAARYTPADDGSIPAARMEQFLEIRSALFASCGDYEAVQEAFQAVDALDSSLAPGYEQAGDATLALGRASLQITPFLARHFESRNRALLAARMGLEEYAYIYAVNYHDQLLSRSTRAQVFSDGEAISAEAATTLADCLARQLEGSSAGPGAGTGHEALGTELGRMRDAPTRLLWQDGLPAEILESIAPYREEAAAVFCAATAGLEMDRGAGRAIRVALE